MVPPRFAPAPPPRSTESRLIGWVLLALIWGLATASLVLGSRVAAAVAALGS